MTIIQCFFNTTALGWHPRIDLSRFAKEKADWARVIDDAVGAKVRFARLVFN